MKHCETCRFFGRNGEGLDVFDEAEDDYRTTGHRPCHRIIHGNGIVPTPRQGVYGEYRTFSALKDQPAVVVDGSGYAAVLKVLPHFGCTLHEPEMRESSRSE